MLSDSKRNRLFKSFLSALLACVLAAYGLLVPGGGKTAQAAGTLPANGSFEESGSNGKPTGWTVYNANQLYERSSDQTFDGAYSAKITNVNFAAGLRSAKMPVTAGKQYEASVMSYNTDTNSELYLEFWDASNRRLTPVGIHANKTRGEWYRSEIRQAAPAGAVTATLLLYLSTANIGTAYYDTASFREVPDSPAGDFDHLVVTTSKTLFQIGDEGTIDWYGTRTDGSLLTAADASSVVYESLNPAILSVHTSTGAFTALGVGSAGVRVRVTAEGSTKTDTVTFRVDDFSGTLAGSKTKSTYYTDGKRANIAANIAQYDWAQAERDAAVANAAPYLALNDDKLWSMITGQSVSRSLGIATRYKVRVKGSPDPDDANISNYGNYPWVIDVLNKPWKLKSPITGREFPTNDFASFYESGIDEYGAFNYKLALQNGAAFLTNTQNPSSGWGVDDGWGWIEDNGDIWTFIAYYNHWGIWYNGFVQKALDSLRNAYLYTGDEEYAYKGLLLLDRVADVYPDLDVTAYPWHKGFDNGDPSVHTAQGKATNDIWETFLAKSLLLAYDAFFPAMDALEPRLAAFLGNKADTYQMANPKNSKGAIRKNIEDNIVRQVYPGVQLSLIRGNMGMHQSALALAAVVLDEENTSRQWLEYVFQSGDLVRIADPDAEYGRRYEVTGGDLSRLLVDEVDRDGMGNESGPGYNAIWLNTFLEAAQFLDGYERYPQFDLFQNVKFQKMFSSFYQMVMLGKYTPSIGDSGLLGMPGVVGDIQHDIIAFERWGDPLQAQLIYLKNGNTVSGIHGSIMSADPNGLAGDIAAVIAALGPLQLDSTLMNGYGLAALRDGNAASLPVGTVYDFRNLPIESANRGTTYLTSYSALLFQNTTGPGASITFEFQAPATDTYDIDLLPNKAPSYGKYRYAIDGQWLGTYDFYGGSAPSDYSTLATLPLSAGTHTLKFEYVGQTAGSTGHYAAFKKLALVTEAERRQQANAKPDTQRDVWMYFGRNTGHGHKDTLNLGLHAFGIDLAPDLGYPDVTGSDPKRMEWTENTISHNTVMVDKSKQSNSFVGIPHHFDGGEDVKLVDIEAPHVYPSTEEYRRTTSLIRVDDDTSYAVDFFRVEGGSHHAFSFHSADATVTAEGLALTPQQDGNGSYVGTLAGPAVPFGQKEPNSGSGTNYKGSGFHYLYDVDRDANPQGPFSVDWKVKDTWGIYPEDPNVYLRLTMLNEVDEVALASGQPPQTNAKSPKSVRYMVAQRSGIDLKSTFVSVLEPYKSARFIDSIERLVVKSGGTLVTDGSAEAVKVNLTNGRTDYIVYALDPSVTYMAGDYVQFRGFFGVYSERNGEYEAASMNDGTLLGVIGEPPVIDLPAGSVTGTVYDFTDELSLQNEITVDADLGDIPPQDLVGRTIHVQNDNIRNGTYEIHAVEPVGLHRYRLDIGSATLIRSFRDANDFSQGYVYDIAPGATFRIPLTHLGVKPAAATLTVAGAVSPAQAGTSGQLTVTADGGQLQGVTDVTYQAAYSSTNSSVAEVLPGGVILYKAAGTTVIAATYGELAAEPVSVEVAGAAASSAAPGKPALADDNGHNTGLRDGDYTVSMNMWWGNNGSVYRLYENDVLIDTKLLSDLSPSAQSAVTAISGRTNGVYVYRAELINGYGTTASDPLVVTVTDAAPGVPVLSHDNWDGDGDFIVTMNMWWGTNGATFRLYENGVLIDEQLLTKATPGAQTAATTISGRAPGTYEYRAELVNAAGAASSAVQTVTVGSRL